MKKLLALTFAFAAILIMVGCESTTPEVPTVAYAVTTNGTGLTLTITEDANADGFIIYNDGVAVCTLTDVVTYTDTVPCKLIEVTAYAGDAESDAYELDCAPVVTASIDVWGNSDPDPAHPSGFYFNQTSGSGVAVSLDSTNWAALDYYFADATPFTSLNLVNPGDHTPPYNSKVNGSIDEGTDFDALDYCQLAGDTQTPLVANHVYGLWMGTTTNWTDNDHFGKMKIQSITGSAAPYAAVIQVAYQKIAGLRWVVTP